MAEFTATCHTDECGNNGMAITLEYDEENPPGVVYCGACGQEITDNTL